MASALAASLAALLLSAMSSFLTSLASGRGIYSESFDIFDTWRCVLLRDSCVLHRERGTVPPKIRPGGFLFLKLGTKNARMGSSDWLIG